MKIGVWMTPWGVVRRPRRAVPTSVGDSPRSSKEKVTPPCDVVVVVGQPIRTLRLPPLHEAGEGARG
jgi:hypothetical protein